MAGLSYSRLQMRDSADYYLRLAVDSSLAKDIKWYAHHFARNYADFLYDFNPKEMCIRDSIMGSRLVA